MLYWTYRSLNYSPLVWPWQPSPFCLLQFADSLKNSFISMILTKKYYSYNVPVKGCCVCHARSPISWSNSYYKTIFQACYNLLSVLKTETLEDIIYTRGFESVLGSSAQSQAVSNYMATLDGVFRISPGMLMEKYYNPAEQPWYKQSSVYQDKCVYTRAGYSPSGDESLLSMSQALLDPQWVFMTAFICTAVNAWMFVEFSELLPRIVCIKASEQIKFIIVEKNLVSDMKSRGIL